MKVQNINSTYYINQPTMKGLNAGNVGINKNITKPVISAIKQPVKKLGETLNEIVSSLLNRKNLFKHMNFEPARSVEEAINYSKRLKIKKIEMEETIQDKLEIINDTNEEMTRLYNMSEGDVKMPKKIKFVRKFLSNHSAGKYDISQNALLIAIPNVHADNGAYKKIDEVIKEIAKNQEGFSLGKSFNYHTSCGLILDVDKCLPENILELYKTYEKQPDLLNRKELDVLMHYLGFLYGQLKLLNDPMYALSMLSDMKYKEFASMSVDELRACINKHMQSNNLTKLYKKFQDRKINELYPIDHEFAHAQFCKSHFLGFLSKTETWKRKKYIQPNDLSKAPSLIKEFFSKEGQIMAGKVSLYAQTCVNEFLAEVYATLVQGNKLDKEVIDMFIKCGGKVPKGLKNYIY